MTRLSQLRLFLDKNNLDAMFITSVANIVYLTGFDGFSEIEREGYVFITKRHAYILTDGRYTESVANKTKNYMLQEISSATPLSHHLKQFVLNHKIQTLGIEANNLTVSEYVMIKKIVKKIKPVNTTMLRSIKEKNELIAIKKSCALADNAFKYLHTKIKEGINEKQLALEFELFIKKNNAEVSFPTIVAFGKNASLPHHKTGDKKLKKGDFVLLDFGVKMNNYCSDCTRTLVFGKATEEQKKMHQTVLDAQKKSVDFLNHESRIMKHGIQASRIDKAAREYITSQGYPPIPHSVGHGIGIEVHESPRLSPTSKDILKPGMVFSVEPGIYKPGFGGVRIEDLIAIEESGISILTKSDKKLIEL